MRAAAPKCQFAIDTPSIVGDITEVGSPFTLSGWLIPQDGYKLHTIKVLVDGELKALATHGLKRQDVADAFARREDEDAVWSGFVAEVFVDELLARTATVQLVASFDGHDETLHQFQIHVTQFSAQVAPRERAWTYSQFLACPACAGDVLEQPDAFKCAQCSQTFEKRRGAPLFVRPGEVASSRLLETNPTNPFALENKQFIEGLPHGVILDFGAGNPNHSEHFANVIFHEMLHYTYTDVVSTYGRLPYKNNSFDAIISLAVFEHLPAPWETANELLRVLKPGGIVYVETAFMQPLHADPSHWFNMTLEGVREVFKNFKHLESGVRPHQRPSFGLRMQLETILNHLHADHWRTRLEELHHLLGADFDDALDEKGREALAAGVFFRGTK
jgi:SAM-dependent methyltransferase